MSDRLQELLRQKSLLTEQLAWLEKEIAAERAKTGLPSLLPAPTPSGPARPAPAAASPAGSPADPDSIITGYLPASGDLRQGNRNETFRGCLLYFAAALALVVLGIVGLWFFFKARHGQ